MESLIPEHVLAVKGWDDRHESFESRRVKRLTWIAQPLPKRDDDSKLLPLLSSPAGWRRHLVFEQFKVTVAAFGHPRGTATGSDGQYLTTEQLKVRMLLFQLTDDELNSDFEALVKLGLLEWRAYPCTPVETPAAGKAKGGRPKGRKAGDGGGSVTAGSELAAAITAFCGHAYPRLSVQTQEFLENLIAKHGPERLAAGLRHFIEHEPRGEKWNLSAVNMKLQQQNIEQARNNGRVAIPAMAAAETPDFNEADTDYGRL